MAKNLQEAFIEFHSKIKLDFDDNQLLIEKRGILIGELENYFKKHFDQHKIKIKFAYKNQGSYSMGTGIEPLEGEDYDIDVMLLFDISIENFGAKEMKKHVFDALNKYPRTTEILKPCVRVQYHKNGEVRYHVDLAVYAKDGDKTYLSKKPKYKADDEEWDDSEPEELKRIIDLKCNNPEEKAQFKRVIRYLKRWKDLKFQSTKNGKPTGIAITAIALNGFESFVTHDYLSNKYRANDLDALIKMVEYFIGQFSFFNDNISVKLPVKPYNDLFDKMTLAQKTSLKEKLVKLQENLVEAKNEADPNKASCKLRGTSVFSSDFPEIPKENTAQSRPKAFISSPDQA